jgi:tRNA (guanine-N7-)-methyltransferase
MALSSNPHRPIRSFVKREGRLTDAQRRALEAGLPRFGIPAGDTPLDLAQVFGRAALVFLEIGFGNGEALAAMAAAHPENNYLGVEVHRPGVGALLQKVSADQLANVRVATVDVMEVLARLPDASLAGAFIFFPDPWPKKRHHKRRLVQPPFVRELLRALKPGALLNLATDWEDYARHMLEVLAAEPALENTAGAAIYALRPEARPLTRFERRGLKLGHIVRDFCYRRRI